MDVPPDGLTAAGEPVGVAFIAAMVYAAFRMISDEDAAGHNYFTRLREFLGLATDEAGRPFGLGQLGTDAGMLPNSTSGPLEHLALRARLAADGVAREHSL